MIHNDVDSHLDDHVVAHDAVGRAAPQDGMKHPGRDLTDLGNARRLMRHHGQDLRYAGHVGTWLIWDGGRWQVDETDEVERRAKRVIDDLYHEVPGLPDRERADLLAHAKASQRGPALREMVRLARSEPGVRIRPDELDADPWVLNVANGTVDLQIGTLRPHRREDLLTKLTPVVYDPHAVCPRWLAFLDRVLGGKPELIAFIQRFVGYTLTGLTREQALLLLHGRGANGKSTFLEVLLRLLGDYGVPSDFATFLTHQHDRVRNDIAALKGARMVTAVEAEEGRRLNESLIKQVTGGDTISARYLHQEFFSFQPAFKLFLATNHLPVITGTDTGIWRRVLLLPFAVTIPDHEQDKDLKAKLLGELPGILSWAVQGCLEWQGMGLAVPSEVRAATQSYRTDMDHVGRFLAECCRSTQGGKVAARALYERYRMWCEQEGEVPLTQPKLGQRLGDRGFTSSRTASTRSWNNLALEPEP